MKVSELKENSHFTILNNSINDCTLSCVYTCDLLSLVMSKAKEKCAWVTIMANINSIAVASLADIGCLVIADNTPVDANVINKANDHNITLIRSDLPVFETALIIHKGITNE